jgi:hypothetical protein
MVDVFYIHIWKENIEIVLRRVGEERENEGGVSLIKIYCNHTCKYRNVFSLYK